MPVTVFGLFEKYNVCLKSIVHDMQKNILNFRIGLLPFL